MRYTQYSNRCPGLLPGNVNGVGLQRWRESLRHTFQILALDRG
jgi:hypothetical protein